MERMLPFMEAVLPFMEAVLPFMETVLLFMEAALLFMAACADGGGECRAASRSRRKDDSQVARQGCHKGRATPVLRDVRYCGRACECAVSAMGYGVCGSQKGYANASERY
eukprot:330285-Rhodomonas_salina.11